MPSPTDSTRRKINPATCDLEDLLHHLSTDPIKGLSPKEAERRLINRTAAPLYRTTARRFADCLKRVLREVVLWLLLVVAVIALFFDRETLGRICILLAGGHAVLCAWFLWRADRVDGIMQAYDMPLSRVLRGKRVHRVGANDLVKGDILLLHKGDMVPADCRLLRTDGFVVLERELDGADPDRPSIRLEKDADAQPDETGNYRVSPANMVFAGGVVESGFALAVVIAVGGHTHLGGLIGGVQPAHTKRTPALFLKAGRTFSMINLGLVFLIIPITAIGVFTLKTHYELLDIFLSALAMAALMLTEHLLAKGLFMAATIRRSVALDRDGANAADIKTSVDLETLTTVTDLLLVGTAALHDGRCHPETLWVDGKTYDCSRPEADEFARMAAEWLYVYANGMPNLQEGSADLAALIPAVCDWAEMDAEALLLKIQDIREEADGVSGIFPSVEGNRRITVRLLSNFDTVRAIVDERTPVDTLNSLYHAHRAALRAGEQVIFVMIRVGNRHSVRAMLTYAPHTCRKTAGSIKSLESAGIRVSAFLRDVSAGNAHALTASGLSKHVPASRADDPAGPDALTLLNEGCRAFEGCSEAYIMDAIQALRAAGRTVAVLSVDERDTALLHAADVAITCSPSLYAAAEEGHIRLSPANQSALSANPYARADGQPNSDCATDLCRRRADILVRRTGETGGGVCGVRYALLAADHCKSVIDRAFTMLLLSQAARLVMAFIPLCLGLAPASAITLLLSGLGIDLLVMLAALNFPLPTAPSSRRTMDSGLTRPWITHRYRLIAVAVAAAVPWIIAGVAKLCHVSFGADLTYYGLLCLLSLQIAIFRMDHPPRRDRTALLTTLALVLLYVGALAISLGAGLGLMWSLLLPLVAPLLYVGVYWLLRYFVDTRKQGTAT